MEFIKSIFFLVVTLLSVKNLPAQNIDSLKDICSREGPSKQIEILTDYMWQQRSSDPESAMLAAQLAIDVAERNDLLHQATRTFNVLGVVYRNIGQLDSAYSSYRRALKLSEESNDSIQIAYSLNNIGGYHRLKGSYSRAIEYMLNAMRIFEKINDDEGAAFCSINIGILFRRQKNYEQAVEYLNKAMRIREALNDKAGFALALNQIAEINFELQNYTTALENYSHLLSVYEENNEKKGIAAVYAGIAGVYYEQQKYRLALEYRKRAIAIDREINNQYGIIVNLKNMGRIYLKLGKLIDSEKSLNEALTLVQKSGFQDLEMEIYSHLGELYRSKSNFRLAYDFLLKYETIRDSLFNAEKVEKISEVQSAYLVEQKELENKILRQEIDYEKDLRYLWFAIILLSIILLIVNWRRYKNHGVANKLLKELNETKDKFFKVLAHDLKNPLNTIMGYSEILTEDYYDLQDVERIQLIGDIKGSSQKLFALLDNLLKWANAQSGAIHVVPLKLNLYSIVSEVIMLFQNISHDKAIHVSNNISTEYFVFADENMLKFIFRNLFNNAMKFTPKNGEIVFSSAAIDNNFILVSIQDNGIGIKEEDKQKIFDINAIHTTHGTENEPGSGLGLVLVREFVEKNNGKIWFKSKHNEGTTFYIKLPIAD